MAKASNAEDVKLAASFETVRAQLLTAEFANRLDKPLAYWTLPGDRRLPLAFLAKTLRELVTVPYLELASTSGVGQKKMASLVLLLVRATKEEPSSHPLLMSTSTIAPAQNGNGVHHADLPGDGFDPAMVSEMIWANWRETARLHGIGHERLGRLAPALQSLPSVIWETELSFYLDLRLSEIRELKTHGEKRVNAVLEVFHTVHKMLGNSEPTGLAVRFTPRWIAGVEDWFQAAKSRPMTLHREELIANLVEPLLQQLDMDVGPTVGQLARSRLGIGANHTTVRDQALEMGVTRARVYQMLEDCHKTMHVRWPEGKRLMDEFAQHLDRSYASSEVTNLLGSLRELLYPLKFDAVSEHLVAEQVGSE